MTLKEFRKVCGFTAKNHRVTVSYGGYTITVDAPAGGVDKVFRVCTKKAYKTFKMKGLT